MIEILPPLEKYKYNTCRILPVKCYIDNFLRLQSCIQSVNNLQVRIFLLSATPTSAVNGRSRLRKVGFPTRTHRCRSSEEAHALLGWRVYAYHERWTLLQNSELSFEASFGASPFVNSNIWHLIYKNFNFELHMVLYANMCYVVYSRFIKNLPISSWETNPSFLRWFCHS
jgi:hypothetical protein